MAGLQSCTWRWVKDRHRSPGHPPVPKVPSGTLPIILLPSFARHNGARLASLSAAVPAFAQGLARFLPSRRSYRTTDNPRCPEDDEHCYASPRSMLHDTDDRLDDGVQSSFESLLRRRLAFCSAAAVRLLRPSCSTPAVFHQLYAN